MLVAQEFDRADKPIEIRQKNPNLGSSVGQRLPSNSKMFAGSVGPQEKTLISNGVGFVI